MESKYLTYIDADKNSYKFYKMTKNTANGTLEVEYGRIGNNGRHKTYPLWQFDSLYNNKIRKGYHDSTVDRIQTSDPMIQECDITPDNLFARLYRLSKGYINSTVENGTVSEYAIRKGRVVLDEMSRTKNLYDFNKLVEQMMILIPRKASGFGDNGVKSWLAISATDMPGIWRREQDLLDVAATNNSVASVSQENDGENVLDSGNSFFEDQDIRINLATEKQEEEVKRHLSPRLASKVQHVWRIHDEKHRPGFDSYCEKNNIRKIRQYWHGSRNENWLSIVDKSLMLHPDAVITGKMFGNGLYFAPSSEKSFGYTSYNGTYWARGKSNIAYMGLYAVAIGKTIEPDRYDPFADYGEKYIRSRGGDSLYVKADKCGLRNDELVVYSENAMLLNYIVEFA